MKVKDFFINALKGGAIGAAVIIPGVSGGTLAVILNIYDKMIDAISNLGKDFKKSIMFLLPILAGAVAAFAALYFPLQFALQYAKLPTVLLFAGLMIGSCPGIIKTARADGFKKFDLINIIVPFALVIGICFIPGLGEAELGEGMPAYMYVLLVVMGVVASCALVVPGVSGSMLLMIFGFYEPILATIKLVFSSPLHSIAVLGLFALGLVVGFFTIAKLMQFLLNRYTRATHWAIVGFVLGSIPAILLVIDYATVDTSALQIVLGCVLCAAGAAATFILTRYAESKANATAQADSCEKSDVAENGKQ